MSNPDSSLSPDSFGDDFAPVNASLIERFYHRVVRPALFKHSADDPEKAHERVLAALAFASSHSILVNLIEMTVGTGDINMPTEVFGITFPNPVGLSGGFDKNGVGLNALAALGFGFLECGTVTYHPQPGNLRPRIVRLTDDEALINAMGFNNDGARALAQRLAIANRKVPIGVSLGKSKITTIKDAVEDYRASLALLYPYADYIVFNVSSPNTPGLRFLQEAGRLRELLLAAQEQIRVLAGGQRQKPLLVKFSPDMNDQDLHDALDICMELGVDGIIATNTTFSREGIKTTNQDLISVPGGLSGRPLHARAVQVVREIHRYTEGKVPIIGVGGIFTVDDAEEMLNSGASLIQLYTGMIYEGPTLPGKIVRGLHGRRIR